jgi:hypothetical protein
MRTWRSGGLRGASAREITAGVMFWYAAVLLAHSWLRWGVLASTTWCALQSSRAWRQRRPFTPADQRRVRLCVGLIDTQLLLGGLLYVWLSPIDAVARQDVSAAMGNDILRFFLVEHPFSMALGIAAMHVGAVLGRRHGADTLHHRTAARAAGAALLCFLVGVPWPGLPYARPLARLSAAPIVDGAAASGR